MKINYTFLIAAMAVFSLAGSVQADESAAINDICPVKGKAADGSKSVEYTATFCCEKCVAKFEKDPAKYAKKVAEAEEGKCAFSGKDVDAEATSTVKIAVCCGGCEKKVTAEPEKYLGKIKAKS
jgi:YHS domain-containing protein